MKITVTVTLICLVFGLASSLYALDCNSIILIDDFNDGTRDNSLGGKTIGDEEVVGGCIPSFTKMEESTYGRKGHSLRLEFDVTPQGSFSFYTTLLQSINQETKENKKTIDLTGFSYFSFWLKSELEHPRFSFEVHKDLDGDGVFILSKDTSSKVFIPPFIHKTNYDEWRKVVIPFKRFRKIANWNDIVAVGFVFDNTQKSGKGELLVDNLLVGSNYPSDDEVATEMFPGRLQLNLFMLNGEKLQSGFNVSTTNQFDILLKNIHPFLETISIEISEDGGSKWYPLKTFYEHTSGKYEASWEIKGVTKKRFYYLRVLANDIFGNEVILGGPFHGMFIPDQTA